MNDNPIEIVSRAMRESQLLRAADRMRGDAAQAFIQDACRLRALAPREVLLLEKLGNCADDWAGIRVTPDFDAQRVRHCQFHGNVILGCFAGALLLPEGIKLPSGVYHSSLADCIVGDDALVRHVGMLAGYAVGQGAFISNCGSVACTHRTTFGNGQCLPLGIEGGGRDLPVFAEITLPLAAALTSGPTRHQFLNQYQLAIAEYLSRAASMRAVIERGAIVRNTSKVWDTFVGPHAQIEDANSVDSCTLLSSAEEPARIQSGACLSHVLLQWGSSCTTGAVVERAVLLEHAHVERRGSVTASLIGPNTTVSEGEVTASLVGPFVGFHHQALLIAVRWPEGRGNVSFGAAVGCNHTSRAPDQECWLGEGTFMGLGTQVKFPVDLSLSPYSVIASGTTLSPQKVQFPFSLIRTPPSLPSGVPTGCNELIPAWTLSENLYAIMRMKAKFRARNRSSRHVFDFEVFRSDTVDQMRDACGRLNAVEPIRDVYTTRELGGLGKNYTTELHRDRAVSTYQFFIRYYALLGLLEQSVEWRRDRSADSIDLILTTPTTDPRWEHQRTLLTTDLNVSDVVAALRELPEMLESVGLGVEQSKQRDDRRGEEIIVDYAQTHAPAYRDPVVRETWGEVRRLQAQTRSVFARLEQRPYSRNGHDVAFAGLSERAG